jgi:hypothetical protein
MSKASAKPGLHWKDRPVLLKEAIQEAFHSLSCQSRSTWTYNGDEKEYNLLSINQYQLLKHIIQSNYPKQKNFTVLDIGAGNFSVNAQLLKELLEDKTLPDDIEVHLVGVRGEHLEKASKSSFFQTTREGPDVKMIHQGRFYQYNIGGFSIENIVDEFDVLSENGFPLDPRKNKIDFIFSSFTFIHLVDALGTFLQAYSLLKPTSGYFLSDGFYFALPQEDDPKRPGKSDNYLLDAAYLDFDVCSDINLYWLLNVANVPYLINGQSESGSLNAFLLRRPDDKLLAIPLAYESMKKHQAYLSRTARYMSAFHKTDSSLSVNDVYVGLSDDVTGEERLFDELKNKVFKPKGPYLLARRCYPKNMVFSLAKSDGSLIEEDLKALSWRRLQGDCHVSIRPRKLKAFLSEKRHVSPNLQHEYDKRFGLVLK